MKAEGIPRRSTALLDAPSVAQLLAIPVRSVWVLAERGELHHYKLGRRLRFSSEDVQAFIDRARVEVGR